MSTRVNILCLVFVVLLGAAGLQQNEVNALSPTKTPAVETPAVSAYEELLKDGLQEVSIVQLIEVTDNRSSGGKRVITITFETSAATAKQRVDEWMSIITPVIQTVQVHQLNIDELDLAGVTVQGEEVGLFYVAAQDLLDYAEKRITRAQFLDRAKYKASETATTATTAPTPRPAATVAPKPTGPIGTRLNPIRQGVAYSFPGFGSLIVRSEWVRGQTGLAIAYLTFTCERPSSQKCSVLDFLLDAVGNSGSVYAQAFETTIPEPPFWDFMRSDVYGGGSTEGYVAFKITKRETSLAMRVHLALELDDEIFFDLS